MKRKTIQKKCVKVFLLFMLGMLVLSPNLYAQGSGTITVQGIVKDTQGEPVIGASIAVKGTTNGVITDVDGAYKITAPANAVLVASFIGYKKLEIPVGGKTTLNITLEEDAIMLGDVVTIGYATGSKATISGAVSKIKREDMNAGIVNNPADALRGKVAGVNISKVGGDPTSTASFRIRGTTSLSGGNDPLVIIDGIFAEISLLNALAPADIESFTILKDASETAQYGSRGASGVIVVTTTKGKYGTKSLTYDGTFGIESVYKNVSMLDADGYRRVVSERNIKNAIDGGANTNWFEEMQQTGYAQNHNLSFGGGTEESNYRASLGVIDQKGIILNNYMKNYTTKIDASQLFFEKKVQLEFGVIGSKRDQRYVNDYHKTFYSAASFNPTLPVTQNADGTWAEDVNANEVDNPLGRLSIKDVSNEAYINTHGKLSWNINNDWKLSLFGAYTYNSKESSRYVPMNTKQGIREGNGLAYRGLNRSDALMGNASITFKKVIDVHNFNFLGLVEGQSYKYNGFSAQTRRFQTNYFGYDVLQAGGGVRYGDVTSYANGYDIFSFLGRFNYVYNEKYIATVNLRTDGSSKLGKNNKWGFFPSASLAWNMSQEEFIKNLSFFNNLKLRAGYGVTGNQDAIEAYNSLTLLSPDATVIFDGNQEVTYKYIRNANPDLKWETKKMFNIGFDATILNNMLDVTMDYYYSKTSNLLYNYRVPQPPFVYNQLLANVGEMENKGLELTVTVKAINQKDMGLTISANGTYQANKVLSLSGSYMGQELSPNKYQSLGGVSGAGAIGGDNDVVYQMVGQPIGVFYIPRATGLMSNGNDTYRYFIVDNDGNETNKLGVGDEGYRYIAGQSIPKFFLGTNINFRYKAFDIQTQMNGAFGHKIFNGTSLTYMNIGNFPTYNVLSDAFDKKIKDQRVSDYWLERGDYLNIAYISLGYNVNTSKINKWIKTLRVSANVNNVHTFTAYTGLSPLINSSTVNGNLGIDDKRFYPLSRTYSIGLNIQF